MTTVRQETVTCKGFAFVKDLTDDQILCTTCKGVGLLIRDFPYGIGGERIFPKGQMFPYNRRYVGLCPDCYFGVRELCPHCRKPYPERSRHRCECEGAEAARWEEEAAKLREKAEKATRITEAEAMIAGVVMVFSEGLDRYLSWDELADLEPEDRENLGIVWACKAVELAFDAHGILENACDDLHEDALERISTKAAAEELQALLDGWAAKHGNGATSYYPDYGRVIVMDKPEGGEAADAAG